MKCNVKIVYLAAIFGLLLAATLMCGCTSSQKAPVTEKVTTVPTTTEAATKVATEVPTVVKTPAVPEKTVETPVNETTENKTEVSKAAEAVENVTASSNVTAIKNMTAAEPVSNETKEVSTPVTSGNMTETPVAEKNMTGNKTPVTQNATTTELPVKTVNKSASI